MFIGYLVLMRGDPDIYLNPHINTPVFLPLHFSAINNWSIFGRSSFLQHNLLPQTHNPSSQCLLSRCLLSRQRNKSLNTRHITNHTRAHRISFSSQIELFIIKIIIAVIVSIWVKYICKLKDYWIIYWCYFNCYQVLRKYAIQYLVQLLTSFSICIIIR